MNTDKKIPDGSFGRDVHSNYVLTIVRASAHDGQTVAQLFFWLSGFDG